MLALTLNLQDATSVQQRLRPHHRLHQAPCLTRLPHLLRLLRHPYSIDSEAPGMRTPQRQQQTVRRSSGSNQ